MYQDRLKIFDFHKLNYFIWHRLDIKLYQLMIFHKDLSFPETFIFYLTDILRILC